MRVTTYRAFLMESGYYSPILVKNSENFGGEMNGIK